jgi:hypothetical protein
MSTVLLKNDALDSDRPLSSALLPLDLAVVKARRLKFALIGIDASDPYHLRNIIIWTRILNWLRFTILRSGPLNYVAEQVHWRLRERSGARRQ